MYTPWGLEEIVQLSFDQFQKATEKRIGMPKTDRISYFYLDSSFDITFEEKNEELIDYYLTSNIRRQESPLEHELFIFNEENWEKFKEYLFLELV